ncbi:hypothetical protein LF599_07520 [Pseudodesulfovibrio thermohalotolerans]|uniref:hypothetical protein n=1 Tax=Pseudodesulfovibrio thermohalotolerans TaxID=2880651 RepID=UPI00244170AF|nr:hypothetical protein [Pseudodesulfovibrio thermohalotolerans]WFS64003.1 hypothetical protein LF599_07520 [Pseudodesulfovibrio thermohalotolerans]
MKCQKCGETLPGPSQRHRANPFCQQCLDTAFYALPPNPAEPSKSFMSPRSIKQLEEVGITKLPEDDSWRPDNTRYLLPVAEDSFPYDQDELIDFLQNGAKAQTTTMTFSVDGIDERHKEIAAMIARQMPKKEEKR